MAGTLIQMLKAVAHQDRVLALVHRLRVVLVGRTILGRHHWQDIRGMSVARSHGSHAHTAHINQNEGAGYGTILQECISCSSWYACHIDFELYFVVLGWIMIFLKTKICTGLLWEMSWTLCHGRKQSWFFEGIAPAFVWELWHAAEGAQSISESGIKT